MATRMEGNHKNAFNLIPEAIHLMTDIKTSDIRVDGFCFDKEEFRRYCFENEIIDIFD